MHDRSLELYIYGIAGIESGSIFHPPTLWLGGVSIPDVDLPQDVPLRVFNSLSGCLFNATYTHTFSEAPFLLTSEDSVANM